LRGGIPVPIEGIVGIEGNEGSVICPVCGTIWQISSIMAICDDEEQQKFWDGQGCPDCLAMKF